MEIYMTATIRPMISADPQARNLASILVKQMIKDASFQFVYKGN